jgi:hydroxyacylglutathione hydrolase
MASGMFLETVRSPGLSHLSYLIGHQGRAAVIDPRRDCDIYVDMANRRGASIDYIFETHRNEDYVIGSKDLARMTGADIYHGSRLDFGYGRPVSDGDTFDLGDLRFKILETPGHTFESISIALIDTGFGEDAVGVFTGDALFVGDVGRTDFFPDQAEEVAGLLYDSIFKKILPLGDQVILYPSHGAGSVCGEGMAEREFSTLGIERRYNQALQKKNRDDFIRFKVNEQHDMPPYFRRMEKFNQEGSAPPIGQLSIPKPLTATWFNDLVGSGAVILDVRSPEAIGGALIPGSLGIPLDMVPAFAGWFLPYDSDLLMVVDAYDEVKTAFRHLTRIGYDRVIGFLDDGLHAWEVSGRHYQTIPTVHTSELVRRINREEDFTLLDVRKEKEFQQARLPGALHVYVGELLENLHKVPKDRNTVTFCGSGQRAVIAATILKRAGYENVANCLGSMAACSAVGCPVIEGGENS